MVFDGIDLIFALFLLYSVVDNLLFTVTPLVCVFGDCFESNTFSESHNNYDHSRPPLQHNCCKIRIRNVSAQLEPRVTIAVLTIKTLFIDD